MRFMSDFRKLKTSEVHIALKVFGQSVPYDQVAISNAVGWNDRPFTVPTSLHVPLIGSAEFLPQKYIIHAGDLFNGMGLNNNLEAQSTLIHELTHVWQGEHDKERYYLFCLAEQAVYDNPYAYDKKWYSANWDSYGLEQQAQMVEDWYTDGKVEYNPRTNTGDWRFYFIKAVIRGEKTDFNWLSARAVDDDD